VKTTPISVTDAARNFADCVNRVRYQNMSFVLLKNGTAVARLVPEKEKVCLGRDLAKVLREVDLPTDEAIAWNRDLKKARKSLKPQPDKWR
jgi:antitoxin (DNA-binding transcriptional repressor) of toxin-antitoxin stability system